MQLPDQEQRGYAFTAAGHAARLHERLTPQLYAVLRVEGAGGGAEHAIRDVLTYVPFRRLPSWLKWRWVLATVRDKVQGWWLRAADAGGDAWRALRRRK
ncbi:hypothetical protein RFN58_25730 [Streptomyces iakyrus]|uniref:hypothetical protein n=1 Tax=Streptomyces iakyrus TaxID=68219 RepID=UPI001FD78F71|nr:hypothetical protein [Streptomyces iakyrus]